MDCVRTYQFLLGKANHNVILVTSTISGEGKTFVATNLAVSLALLDKRVVVVGLDIRRPKLLECFGSLMKEIKGKKGLPIIYRIIVSIYIRC